MDLLENLFSTDGALAALGVLITTAVIALGRVLYGVFADVRDERRRGRELVMQLFIDVRITVENCKELSEPAVVRALKEIVSAMEKSGHPYRAYIADYTDHSLYDAFDKIAHRYSHRIAAAYREYATLDRLATVQYRKFETDAFVALALDRKLLALDDFYDTIRKLRSAGDRLLAFLAYECAYDGLLTMFDAYRGASDERANWTKHD